MRGIERGHIYETVHDVRLKGTDNAPAWWMHYAAFHEVDISDRTISDVIAAIPVYFFDVGAQIPDNYSNMHLDWSLMHGERAKGQHLSICLQNQPVSVIAQSTQIRSNTTGLKSLHLQALYMGRKSNFARSVIVNGSPHGSMSTRLSCVMVKRYSMNFSLDGCLFTKTRSHRLG
ncbi:MAG TPA: hypothetical protein VNU46_01000 [Gemmatimonadaceae bacterium]|jgi:hypothetical protein|nr:hypothetical protein [Gemmatimonadaceae bacterium]